MNAECFQIDRRDNVATLLQDATEDTEVLVRGDTQATSLQARALIRAGHKIAVCDIREGDHILKYGQPIGVATSAIARGEWVHLHNCRSLYDAKSSSLDLESGERKETRYA